MDTRFVYVESIYVLLFAHSFRTLKFLQSGKFGKLNKLVRFPETLDLAPYVSGGSEKSHDYKLYGVIVHLDVMNAAFSGHYVCYIRNSQNKWYKADDNTVNCSYLINAKAVVN